MLRKRPYGRKRLKRHTYSAFFKKKFRIAASGVSEPFGRQDTPGSSNLQIKFFSKDLKQVNSGLDVSSKVREPPTIIMHV